ncbi:MAG: iron-containing alcohol dehydrogenase [Anaerolineae bacterium]
MSARIFRNANDIVYGRGALGHLKTLKCQRVLLLTGRRAMEKTGVLAEAVSCLKAAGAQVEVVKGVQPEPPLEDVEAHLEAARALQPDLIVGLGGGSVIDSAKALWAFYEHPELERQALFKTHVSRPYPLPNLRRKARLVAIPSTSGTGSETSAVSILVEAGTRLKRVLLSAELVPDVAIIDPDIAAHMPPRLVAHTGLDALAHAVEAAISPWCTDFSEPPALKAIQLIFRNLRAAYSGSDREARAKMHYAATLAGMAINNSITGLAHGMDKIGLVFGLPHGLTVALLLPHTLRFSATEAGAGYARIARTLGLAGRDEEALARAFIQALVQLGRDVGLPQSFRELGIGRDQFKAQIAAVSEAALKAGPTVFSPRVPTAEELEQLYWQAYGGAG